MSTFDGTVLWSMMAILDLVGTTGCVRRVRRFVRFGRDAPVGAFLLFHWLSFSAMTSLVVLLPAVFKGFLRKEFATAAALLIDR